MKHNAPLALASFCALCAVARGQGTDVLPEHRFAWSGNAGWLNWRDAGDPQGSAGAAYYGGHLGGLLWAENAGWITLGDGTPTDGRQYGNTDGSDCGVNIDPFSGELSGYAWGENIGWINFRGGAIADPANAARLDFDEFRLRGYAWAENVGWINLDDDEHFVAFYCPSDFNRDEAVNTLDVLAFLNAWAARFPEADFNRDGAVNTLDVIAFLNAWTGGC
jgi:hypothetical protein